MYEEMRLNVRVIPYMPCAVLHTDGTWRDVGSMDADALWLVHLLACP